MKRIGSGQLMVTEGDKVMLPANLGLIGASRMAPQQTQHQQLLLHSIQEDGSSQVLTHSPSQHNLPKHVDSLPASSAASELQLSLSKGSTPCIHLCRSQHI